MSPLRPSSPRFWVGADARVLSLCSFMKNVYTVFSVDDNAVGFAPLA